MWSEYLYFRCWNARPPNVPDNWICPSFPYAGFDNLPGVRRMYVQHFSGPMLPAYQTLVIRGIVLEDIQGRLYPYRGPHRYTDMAAQATPPRDPVSRWYAARRLGLGSYGESFEQRAFLVRHARQARSPGPGKDQRFV